MQESSTTPSNYSYVRADYKRAVGAWLLLCVVVIGMMVAVGGYTRLSGSGLSITEWKPIHGTIPPLNVDEWQEEFDKYRTIPQYQQINKGMSLDEFKTIYWPEFWHRNLGRLIGLLYGLPLFYFIARRAFTRPFAVRLVLILGLGGAQGAIGWIMVASGLEERLYVHHIKLALHFGMAMLLASAVFWSWLCVHNNSLSLRERAGVRAKNGDADKSPHPNPLPKGEGFFACITLLIFTQLVIGAMVAGLHAGLIYNSFPMMNGDWIAPDVFVFEGSWFDHIPLMQFIHRWLAKLIVVLAVVWWLTRRPGVGRDPEPQTVTVEQAPLDPGLRRDDGIAIKLFFTVLFAQFLLGVLTLINVVPIHWAMLHQLGGFLLLLASLNLLYSLKLVHISCVQKG